jgi:cholesterol oxidase
VSAFDYDVVVVGSGFGGSVSALRLSEKGYRVAVLEAGRRFAAKDFPKTNWDVRRFLWMPRLGLKGFQRMTLLKDVLVISGAGVGGGSLVYANTLYEPFDAFYTHPQWSRIADWKTELAPYYDQAKRMLGAATVPWETAADDVMKKVADDLGVAHTFHHTQVGVYFGEPGQEAADPYFGGAGPSRSGCIACGACMVGCRFNAKNTLDHNYLYLAEKLGADVHAEREVVDVVPLAGGGYEVVSERSGAWFAKDRRSVRAEQVVLSAGVLGTLRLLFDLRDRGRLPHLSPRLGELVRTNSEAIVGATADDDRTSYSGGVSITSSIYPDDHTHIEPVRYPKGSSMLGLLATKLVDGGPGMPRPLRFLLEVARHPIAFLRSLSLCRWAERTIILLVMQNRDNSLRLSLSKGLLGRRLTSHQGSGPPNPTYIPVANEAARSAAAAMGGHPSSTINEVLLNVPTTAHILGGACMGLSPDEGVIDPYHRVYGHPGLHVADGSSVSANLGVNPSLTITTLAERAMAYWPNKGDPDPRPAPGEPYRAATPVAPRNPAVPAGAPGALRLPSRPMARTAGEGHEPPPPPKAGMFVDVVAEAAAARR